MSSDNENVRVVCRCRPFSEKEKLGGFTKCISMDTRAGSISISNQKGDHDAKTFTFDSVFDEDSKQVF